MEHENKNKQAFCFWNLNILFLFVLLSLGLFSNANASGSKLPTASDGTVITAGETNSEPGAGTVSDIQTTKTPDVTAVPPIKETYSHLDPGHIVPNVLLAKTLDYYDTNKAKITNKNFIGIIDFKQHNSKERFYIIDMNTGVVETYLVAHGKNSDTDYDGFATTFSNTTGSEMSSIGFYLAAETYEGSHGYSLKLDGLSSTNSNARARSIVIHPADYVAPGGKIGRSWGCPALEPRYSVEVINKLKGGSLLYAE